MNNYPPRSPYAPYTPIRESHWWVYLILVILAIQGWIGATIMHDTFQWTDRGCDFHQSVILAVTHGQPGTWEYCNDSDQ